MKINQITINGEFVDPKNYVADAATGIVSFKWRTRLRMRWLRLLTGTPARVVIEYGVNFDDWWKPASFPQRRADVQHTYQPTRSRTPVPAPPPLSPLSGATPQRRRYDDDDSIELARRRTTEFMPTQQTFYSSTPSHACSSARDQFSSEPEVFKSGTGGDFAGGGATSSWDSSSGSSSDSSSGSSD